MISCFSSLKMQAKSIDFQIKLSPADHTQLFENDAELSTIVDTIHPFDFHWRKEYWCFACASYQANLFQRTAMLKRLLMYLFIYRWCKQTFRSYKQKQVNKTKVETMTRSDTIWIVSRTPLKEQNLEIGLILLSNNLVEIMWGWGRFNWLSTITHFLGQMYIQGWIDDC